jgi:cobalamin biosynthesis Mg chelatase CobN
MGPHAGMGRRLWAQRRQTVAEDFYSFEKALRELHKTEEELKKLVSEGEIRAFRDESSMKFKKEDIERYRKALGTDLPTHEAPTGELHDELFGEDSASGSDDVGMVTQQISDSSFLEEATDAPPPPTMAGRSSKSGRKASPRAGTASAAGTSSKSASRRRQEVAATDEGSGMRFMLVLGSAILLYATLVSFSAREGTPDGVSEPIANMMKDMMKK